MKIRLRKYFRQQARIDKKAQRNRRNADFKQDPEFDLPEETYVPKKRKKKDVDYEMIQLDQDIEELEKKLGLRDTKQKNREKNWKKIKKNLELEGLGSDFYELLEGKVEKEEDQISISPQPSPEIEFADPEDLNEEKSISFESEASSVQESPIKKQKISETKEKKIPESNAEVQKQLKGLLNRLSDQNIEPITTQISNLYTYNSNLTLNQAFWEFLSNSLSTESIPTQLLATYSAEISALSKLISRDTAAFILDKLYTEKDSLNVNKAALVSYLYYFGVINSDIIAGFIKYILKKIDEDKIEILITIFNLVGFTLRKSNSSLLKDLIELTNAACKSCQVTSNRMKFMIEILNDIKNNKKKQNLAEDRLKALKNWVKKGLPKKTGDDSQITAKWEELDNSNWRSLLSSSSTFAPSKKTVFTPEIEALARSQHMNTDSRKQIFCLLMSSEDYMDAFAKISNLKKQERDIVRVILTSCGQETVYNKFYSLLGTQLCKHKNSYKYSFQYALWDTLKQFQDFSIRKIANISKFYSDLILNTAVGFYILKAIDFDEMNEHLSLFLRILIENIIVSSNVLGITQIFSKCANKPDLKSFCEGLRVFIKLVIVKNPRKGVVEQIGIENFVNRAKTAKKSLKVYN
jgi:nucleolar MIF4G domain-containing protein 1